MAYSDWAGELEDLIKGTVVTNELMRQHTSWRIGGPAEVFVNPLGVADLRQVFKFSRQNSIPLTVIGAGTNLLVRDGGIKGIVVKIGEKMASLDVSGENITAGGGVKLGRLAAAACEAGIGGFEFLAGIPGTVGGAVVMNAGANGSSISGVVQEVFLLDPEGNEHRMGVGEMGYGYRTSFLQDSSYTVVGAAFCGRRRSPGDIKAEMSGYLARRKASQPLDMPNAGSVFKNPPGDAAGRLIEAAGCKGLRVGDAQVSPKHANFIVNLGAATARDVLTLIEEVRGRVFDRYGIKLLTEIRVLGID